MTRKKKRQAKDFERYFTKNVVYKQPICTQNSAHLLVIKEIQIKITRYISIHTMKMAKIRLTTPNLGLSWQMNISKTQAMAEGQYCFSSGSSTESPTILVGPEGKFYIWVEL